MERKHIFGFQFYKDFAPTEQLRCKFEQLSIYSIAESGFFLTLLGVTPNFFLKALEKY